MEVRAITVSPARVAVVAKDGSEHEVPLRYGLDADLTRLKLNEMRKRDGGSTVVERKA